MRSGAEVVITALVLIVAQDPQQQCAGGQPLSSFAERSTPTRPRPAVRARAIAAARDSALQGRRFRVLVPFDRRPRRPALSRGRLPDDTATAPRNRAARTPKRADRDRMAVRNRRLCSYRD